MSSMPPYPPYDPKAYHEQQKAARHAQRAAWKAAYGYPRVPSIVGPVLLIGIGVVALLVVTGHMDAGNFWAWYGRWWPLVLIGAGLALLGEWSLDMRRKIPVRRSVGFVSILAILAIVGLAHRGWGPFHTHFGENGDDVFNVFNLPEHDQDQQVQTAQIAANASIDIENPRGDISVTASNDNAITVQAHEVAYSRSDSEAKSIFETEAVQLSASGTSVLVKSSGHSNGQVNLTVSVPKTAHVAINSGKGDLTIAGLGAGLTINSVHGDTHLNTIAGFVQIHFANKSHDFSAHQIEGDLVADGSLGDVTLSEIKGRVTINGEIYGEVHMENIGGMLNLHTSITDLQIASLPGDLTLDSDDLRVTEAKGAVHAVTHSKDVDLSEIAGEVSVENRDGRIAIEPTGNFNIDAKNNKGDIELTLAPNTSATVNGRARNGEIVSEFGLTISGDENKTVNGRIGGGAAHMTLSTDNGDLAIKRDSSANAPAAPATPAPAHAPHFKGSRHQEQEHSTRQ